METVADVSLTGRIVYLVSSDVREYDLVTGERRIVYGVDNAYLWKPLIKVDDRSFIIHWAKSDGSKEITLVTNGQARGLGEKGRTAAIFPAHNKLFYFSRPPGSFYEATFRDNRLESPRLLRGGLTPNYPVFVISDNELLVRQDHGGPYMKYDLRTGLFVDTAVKEHCFPLAWRSKTQELVCHNDGKPRSSHLFDLVTLDGRRRPIPGLRDNVVAYVPQGDYLIMGRGRWTWDFPRFFRMGERSDLALYFFATGTDRLVEKDVPIGGWGNTIWYPSQRSNP